MPHKRPPPESRSVEEPETPHTPIVHSDLQSLPGDTLVLESPCSAIMTSQPVCCEPGDPVDVVARLMVVEDLGAVPVVNSLTELQPIGMITDRDLMVKVVAEGHDPKSILVDEVMTRTALTCMADSPIRQAMNLMAEHQVRRVPVVDAEHRLVGIIAQADIAIRLAQPADTARVIREISQSILDRGVASSSVAGLPPESTSSLQNTLRKEQDTMPRGEKSAHASTAKRQVKSADRYEPRGREKDEAERRAAATVNKQTGEEKKRSPARKKTADAARSSQTQSRKKPASSSTRKTATSTKRG